MQVLCVESSDEKFDIACSVCGRAYKVYYSRLVRSECEEALRDVAAALEQHHGRNAGAEAHPELAFNVPEWSGPAHMSGAALLSGAPLMAIAKAS